MPAKILMPALSPTMEDGTLAKWLVKEGDDVEIGDILAEIEADMSTMDLEAVASGRISAILVAAGTRAVKIDTPIALLDATVGSDDLSTHSHGASAASASPTAAGAATAPSEAEPGADWPTNTGMQRQTVREALRDAMAEEMRRDENVFLMGEEVGEYQGTYKISHGLLEEFGARRVVDTPITEQAFAGLAVGAAFAGLRPIVEFMTFNFAMQAMDQIVNSAAKTLYMSGGRMPVPLVFRGPNGAAARVGAQHSQDYAAWYAHVPGLKVAMPYSASDAKGLLKSAIRDPNPVIFLESETLYGLAFDVPILEDFTIPFGKARIWREGRDITLVSFGTGMSRALEAAERLASDGIDAEVIDLRTLRPMDTATVIESVKKTNRCVTVEDGWPVGSIGDHIAAVLMRNAFDYLEAPVLACTGTDVPMPYAANLEKLALPGVDDVVAAARRVCCK